LQVFREAFLRDYTGPVLWALFLVLSSQLARGQTISSQSPATLDVTGLRKYVQERMVAGAIPSIAISVVQDHRILWEEGFGLANRENQIFANANTPFYLASITKAITGTAIMVLRDQGKINLDHPVNEYLGKAKVHSPMWNAAEATVRRVATHTAGLTTYNRKCAIRDAQCEVSTDTAIRRYGILFWPPGDHFDYSNLGYGILGEVVSHASGESYADFLRDEVFHPLGMQDCFLGIETASSNTIAAQYDSSSHARTPAQISDTPGASSAHCSVHDLALFGMFALGDQLATQKRILSNASRQMMFNPTVETGDGERYGFGWSLQPDHHGYVGLFAQGGTSDSFAVLQMIPSEKIAVAVIANTGTTVPFEIVDKILSELLPRYRESLDQESLASKKPVTQRRDASTVTSNSLVGNWSGSLQTWKGEVPLAIEISSPRQVRARWASDQWMTASDVDISDTRFYCVFRGRIETPDASQSLTDIELELYLRGKSLVGAGTTKDGAQLPHWVRLERSSTKDAHNPAQ
jgi:CubicO group peptidase (beta-lactamase class C family)